MLTMRVCAEFTGLRTLRRGKSPARPASGTCTTAVQRSGRSSTCGVWGSTCWWAGTADGGYAAAARGLKGS